MKHNSNFSRFTSLDDAISEIQSIRKHLEDRHISSDELTIIAIPFGKEDTLENHLEICSGHSLIHLERSWHNAIIDDFEGQPNNKEANAILAIVANDSEGSRLCAPLNEYAIKQLLKTTKIGTTLYDDLKITNPILLCQNINHQFRFMNPKKFLIRLRSAQNDRAHYPLDEYEVRAFLPQSYSRVDNIHLIQIFNNKPFDAFLNGVGLSIDQIEITDDELYIHLKMKNATPERLLNNVDDKAISKYKIRNSEVERFKNIEIAVEILRLVCTNGMTSRSNKIERIAKKLLTTSRFINHLPDDILEPYSENILREDLQTGITNSIVKSMNIMLEIASDFEKLNKEPIHDNMEYFWSLTREEKNDYIKRIIGQVVKDAGMRVIAGVNSEQILEAFWQEAKRFDQDPTMLTVYNAVTNFASHYIRNNSSTLPPRRGHPTKTFSDAGDRLLISERITHASSKILDPRFKWSTIRKDARQQRTLSGPDV